MTGTPDPARAASEAIEERAKTAAPKPPGPFADLAWLLDAGLEVRIAPYATGMKLTLLDGGEQVGDDVLVWPTVIAGAAIAMARMAAEQAGYAPGGRSS